MKILPDTTRGLLALWLLPGLGPKRIVKLWEEFGNIEDIFRTKPKYLAEILGLNPDITQPIPTALQSNVFNSELELIKQFNIDVIDFTQQAYPPALKEIHNFPPILYLKGDHSLNSGFNLAFVGSRKASFAGKNMCGKLIKRLSALNPDTVIVSGLAIGIDTVAHQSALDAGLKTIAVLAHGLSSIYPERNRNLADKILPHGLLVSEFPMASKPIAGNFPLRNRIISGLSKGVVVVEAGEKSGATITAGYALEQNRELFALPGPADSKFYKGTNRLIQRGMAKLVMESEDILDEFQTIDTQLSFEESSIAGVDKTKDFSKEEVFVLELIRKGFDQKDQLITHSKWPVQKLLSQLTSLEIKGAIVLKPGAVYDIVE